MTVSYGHAFAATQEQAEIPPADSKPVDLTADSLTHDEKSRTVTATGNVQMVQEGRILRADEVTYFVDEDKIIARGNVVLNEPNGDVHFAEEVSFANQMKDGFVDGLRTFLNDGSRFVAKDGERRNAEQIVMHEATYTPCEPCRVHPEKDPLWQIKASDVTYHEQEHRVSYNNARFELWGVPVAYTPYFSHPDGTITQKSGFLTPSFGYKSGLGPFVTEHYYWGISPDMDATVGLMAMREENPLVLAEFRKRWENARLKLAASGTDSSRPAQDQENDVVIREDEELRGSLFGEGLWDIDEKLRAGFDVEMASDDQYLRQYDFSSDDVLENQVYLERFSGRDYAAARVISFQDVRVREEQEDQPELMPEIEAGFIGEPGSVPLVGGRWQFDTSLLGLRRQGDEQDMDRISARGGWQRRFISDYGLVAQADASLRGDVYYVRDRNVATPGSGRSNESKATRVFPQANVKVSYPVAKPFEKFQAVIEPIAAVTAAPNIDINDDIPNEDSRDVQVDSGNLFDADRFPGIDVIEDRSRVTYGMQTGLYGYEGSHLEMFTGQSYRFYDDDNPFPEGSGLNQRQSDFVGQVSASYGGDYNLDYRFQLGSRNMGSQRHEVDAMAVMGRVAFGSRYLFAKSLEGTDIEDSREQVQNSVSLYLTPKWRVDAGATQDLGENQGLRKASVGLNYFGQCLSWSLSGERNLTDEDTGDSSSEVFFRIGLKNLGDFEDSGWKGDEE